MLVDLILIVKIEKKHKKYLHTEIYHTAMKMIFKHMIMIRIYDRNRLTVTAFKSLAETDINICCADDFIRCCHLIIDEIMMNYEEQVLITDIKKN